MKTKNILVGLIILFVLCSISSVSAADLNETQSLDNNFVATTNDDVQLTFQYDDNISSSSDSLNELKNQINKASDGSVINLNKDYSGSDDSGITIDKSLTINGQGHTIDCANLKDTYLFKSTSGKITLENLIIKNNKNSMYSYGTIYIKDNAQYTINNCTFISNTAGGGGAIYNGAKEYQLTIKNSKFINNIASDNDGGAIYSRGELNIENSYFEGNVNLDICSPEGFFNINNTFIKDNYTDFFVNLTQNNGILELNESLSATASVIINGSNTRFMGNGFSINNTCGGYCLFFVNGDNVTFRDVIFNGAGVVVFCDNVHFINCSFINSTHNSIYSLKSTVIIENCNFTNSSSDDGGGVYAEDCNIIIFKSYFKDCWCGGDGGAVKLVSCNYTRIYHSIFINCTSLYDGGGLNLGSCSNSIVFNSSFYNNTCINGSGGGICSVWSECNITNSLFTNNTGLNGGGVYYSNCDKSQITLSTFNSNCAVNGSAVYYFWTRNGNILNSNFTNQTIGYGDDSYGDIINSRFTRTTKDVVCGDAVVYNCTYNNESFNKYGNLSVFKTFRDLYNLLNNNNDTCIVLDCDYVFMLNDNIEGVFISKNLTVDGDNHFVDGRYKSRLFKTIDCNIVFKNIILKNARIPYLGGAIYSQSGSITIINSSLIDNVAQNGAGVYTKTGDITIINSTFTDNHLFDFSDSGLCNGGGIYTDTGDVNINNTLFTSNSALNGGGVYVKTGKTVIYNSRFIDNSAENATSIYCLNNNLNIYNSIFDKTQNMEIITKNIQILNCTFNGTVIPKIPENKPVRVVLTLTAGKKTFKSKVKTKKYTIYLKYKTKGISNLLVYLKINGKTFKAKTNSKGKAVFKIKKITKKKTYKAKITYNGNSKYYSVKKTVKIKIK